MHWNKKSVGWYTWMVSWKWHECKWSCWRCYPGIHMEKLRWKERKFSQWPGHNLKIWTNTAIDKALIDVLCRGGGMQNTRICCAFFYWIPFCWWKAVLWIHVMSSGSNFANKYSGPLGVVWASVDSCGILSDFTVGSFGGYFRVSRFILVLYSPLPVPWFWKLNFVFHKKVPHATFYQPVLMTSYKWQSPIHSSSCE